MDSRWLDEDDQHALDELLLGSPVANLFLLSLSEDPSVGAAWAGVFEGDRAIGALAVLGGLLVPTVSAPGVGLELGRRVAAHVSPTLLVGPREPCDGILESLPPPTAAHDQRLYVCRRVSPGDGRVEHARPEDAEALAELAAAMNLEDLGRGVGDPTAHMMAVRGRIEDGRVFVVRDGRDIVFTVNVGTRHRLGCQIGGTYVPPHRRGEGWATIGLRGLLRVLLREHPLVTLHVREANTSAVALYERTGFVRDVAYRLATW